ncbi:PAS domain S-box protein [Natronosalvus halobius]|uniref:PAS domain S-box protein n=1 Tax=Natronosalvus halobius TaxID=2953746 RepID=UPI00209CD9C0|nr:PAS domain S-box protein [Natronosalvus halobius]USZ73070.1 PAS domain S-box protein [Natronosalvus halobius]
MRIASKLVSRIGGRRTILYLGGFYTIVAAGFPLAYAFELRMLDDVITISILSGFAGLTLLYGGYQLPSTDIRPDAYESVAKWCLRAIGAILVILLFVHVVSGLSDVVANLLILTSLAATAGLGMGYHDGRAKTRTLDARERRREAERYSQELERYKTIVETVNDGIFVVDDDGNFLLVNDTYAEMVGYSRDELVGSHSSMLIEDSEADPEVLMERAKRDVANESDERLSYEMALETASGETVDVEWTISPLPGRGAGNEPGLTGVVRDVTERNRRKRQLEKQNERLESFAGMVAHELRNPVSIGQIYSRELPADENPEAHAYVTEAFDRIEDIIEIMLVLTQGRSVHAERTPMELAAVARDAWDEIDGGEATIDIETDQTAVIDETYVQHLFRNLFDNAIEHGGSDVTITVGDLPTGFYVADDGVGITESEREEIFKTGYTTAGDHGGMGLGLTFVQELVDAYGWDCSVTDSESGGARFEFENVIEAEPVTS